MTTSAIMIPGHPRWQEFVESLSRSCICFETTENARRVLSSMAGVDVEASLAALRLRGGTCDCAIVFELGGAGARMPA